MWMTSVWPFGLFAPLALIGASCQPGRLFEGLGEVLDQVGGVLEADGEAYEAGADPHGRLVLVGDAAMGRARRIGPGRRHISEARRELHEPRPRHEAPDGESPTPQADGPDGGHGPRAPRPRERR